MARQAIAKWHTDKTLSPQGKPGVMLFVCRTSWPTAEKTTCSHVNYSHGWSSHTHVTPIDSMDSSKREHEKYRQEPTAHPMSPDGKIRARDSQREQHGVPQTNSESRPLRARVGPPGPEPADANQATREKLARLSSDRVPSKFVILPVTLYLTYLIDRRRMLSRPQFMKGFCVPIPRWPVFPEVIIKRWIVCQE